MRDYFIRRFLLLIPTLLVITMIVFGVTRIAPGGRKEQAMMEAQMVSMEGGGGRSEGAALSEEQLEQRCIHFRHAQSQSEDWQKTLVVSHWGFIRGLTGHAVDNAQLVEFDPFDTHPGGGAVVPMEFPC